jgi:hypothetical protein
MVDLDVRAVYQARRLSRIVATDVNLICVADTDTGGHQPGKARTPAAIIFPTRHLQFTSALEAETPAVCW